MKKGFCLLLMLVLLLCGCGEASVPEESTTETTAAKTKTVYVHSSLTRSDGNSINRTEYVYRDNGTLSEVVVWDGDGTEVQRYRVNCDENGNPVDWITPDSSSSIRYRFDDQGHTLGTYIYSGTDLVTSTEYTFSGDLRVSATVTTSAQNLEQRIEYTYDENNRLIRQDQYVGGELSAYGICTCDEQGRPLTMQSYDLENNPTSTVTYTYDGNTEKRVITLDSGIIIQTQVLTYDEHHNLLTNTFTDGEGTTTSSEEHTWMAVEVPADSPRCSI